MCVHIEREKGERIIEAKGCCGVQSSAGTLLTSRSKDNEHMGGGTKTLC